MPHLEDVVSREGEGVEVPHVQVHDHQVAFFDQPLVVQHHALPNVFYETEK